MNIEHKIRPANTLKLSLTYDDIYSILAGNNVTNGAFIITKENSIVGIKIKISPNFLLNIFSFFPSKDLHPSGKVCEINKKDDDVIITILSRVLVDVLKFDTHIYTYADDNYELSIVLQK